MTPQEKSLYHQIHPAKLATDRDYLALPVLATQTSGRADRRCCTANDRFVFADEVCQP